MHWLIGDLLNAMDKPDAFRKTTRSISRYLAHQCRLRLGEKKLLEKRIILVSILRAGAGFLQGFIDEIPTAEIHFIAAKRNSETLKPAINWTSIKPDQNSSEEAVIIILDPMLATGGTLEEAVKLAKKAFKPSQIIVASAFSSKRAEQALKEKAEIISLLGDLELNDIGYILIPIPGQDGFVTLDFGDQYCGQIKGKADVRTRGLD